MPEEKKIETDPRQHGRGVSAAALFTPVGGNVYEETVERLAAAIKLGAVGVGQRLPAERVLAPQLGISRVTLREAIRALEQAGYVERRRGRMGGAYVIKRPPDAASERRARKMAQQMGEELIDALEFRRVVEPGAAALAAERVRDGFAEEPEKLRDLADATAAASRADYRATDSQLHLGIADMAHCPPLSRSVADLQLQISDLLGAIPRLEPAIQHANTQHRAIVDAILKGKPALAREEMENHVAATANLLRGFLS